METRQCPECAGAAHLEAGMDSIFECEACGTSFMDNPHWNDRVSL